MEIKITATEVESVAESISNYIFIEAKNTAERQNMKWLHSFVGFYQQLKDADAETDYVYVDLDEVVKEDLPKLISKNIFQDLQSMDINNKSWLCEMMAIYNQLTSDNTDIEDSDKSAESDIGENYDSEQKYSEEEQKYSEEESYYESDEEVTEEDTEPTASDFVIYEGEEEKEESEFV